MIEPLFCAAWLAFITLIGGFELGVAIEAAINRKYYRAGVAAMICVSTVFYIVKIIFYW